MIARKWAGRAVAAVLCVALAIYIATTRGFALTAPWARQTEGISDGFFVVGLFATGIGALALIATTGFFDMFAYGVKSLVMFFTALVRPEDHGSYFDFHQGREARRAKPRYFVLLLGVAHLAVSAAFWVLHNASG